MTLAFEELIDPIPNLPVHERQTLRQAYHRAREAHTGQKRWSGEDYFVHCVEVARILIDLGLDSSVIAAGLLHDVVEDTPVTLEEIEDEFGEEIASLVDGVTKMENLPIKSPNSQGQPRYKDPQYLRKTLLAMTDDVRVVLIKLADRLHNMRTLGHLPPEKQQANARETIEIFAPLASRLGIWQMKWELEDLSFRYLDPERYKMIASLFDQRRADRDADVARIVNELQTVLERDGISAELSGRSKHIYSIWRKMERKDASFDEILDVRAVRVIVPDVASCYRVLGVVHQLWTPIAGEFDDYIAAPKDNFYQSLHTAVFLPDSKTLEVQIRTPEMHAHAEYGVAAHWRYKEGGKGRDEAFERRIRHLRELMEVGDNVDDADEFLDAVRSEVFEDRVYAFTPQGDIIDLPGKSTPIDFAYHIHTDIGHRCRGAKVNGRLVPLDYELKVGDRVEILTAKRGGPSRDWLNPNLGYVRTKRALAKIRQWFRRLDREKMIAVGRDVLERELKRLGVEKNMSHDRVAELFGIDKTEEFLAQVGFADIHPQHIATKIIDLERKEAEAEGLLIKKPAKSTATREGGVQVMGTGGLLTHLSRCCNPVQGDEIVGYITRGRGVSIHRRDCPNVLNLDLSDQERLISVEWGGEDSERYPVPVVINAYDREGLMRDIGTVVAEERINVSDVRIQTQNHLAIFTVTMDVESAAQLSRILSKIERLPNVIEARRAAS